MSDICVVWEDLEAVLDIESKMYAAVFRTIMSPSTECLTMFRFRRWFYLFIMPAYVLKAHLEDVRQAQSEGRNLLSEIYAIVEGNIPPRHDIAQIARLLDVETRWISECGNGVLGVLAQGEACRELLDLDYELYAPRTFAMVERVVLDAYARGDNLFKKRLEKLKAIQVNTCPLASVS